MYNIKKWILINLAALLFFNLAINTFAQSSNYSISWSNNLLKLEIPESFKPSRVDLKLNNQQIASLYNAPYEIEIKKDDLLDMNNATFVFYDENQQVIDRKQYYFKANTNELKQRSSRLSSSYPPSSMHIYQTSYIPVLMYHSIADTVPQDSQSNTVSTALFKQQLQTLLVNGYTPINFYDLYLCKLGIGGLPQKPFIVTFDDGYLNNYTIAYPILKELGVQATFFVSSNWVGINIWRDHFNWDQAKEMEQSGLIDIQSHSANHVPLNGLSGTELKYEIISSFSAIEQHLGKRDVKVLAYPEFKHSETTLSITNELNVFFQITNLAKTNALGNRTTDIKRIHVHNKTSPDALLKEIQLLSKPR